MDYWVNGWMFTWHVYDHEFMNAFSCSYAVFLYVAEVEK
jgi:hypothetical protein